MKRGEIITAGFAVLMGTLVGCASLPDRVASGDPAALHEATERIKHWDYIYPSIYDENLLKEVKAFIDTAEKTKNATLATALLYSIQNEYSFFSGHHDLRNRIVDIALAAAPENAFWFLAPIAIGSHDPQGIEIDGLTEKLKQANSQLAKDAFLQLGKKEVDVLAEMISLGDMKITPEAENQGLWEHPAYRRLVDNFSSTFPELLPELKAYAQSKIDAVKVAKKQTTAGTADYVQEYRSSGGLKKFNALLKACNNVEGVKTLDGGAILKLSRPDATDGGLYVTAIPHSIAGYDERAMPVSSDYEMTKGQYSFMMKYGPFRDIGYRSLYVRYEGKGTIHKRKFQIVFGRFIGARIYENDYEQKSAIPTFRIIAAYGHNGRTGQVYSGASVESMQKALSEFSAQFDDAEVDRILKKESASK